MNLLTLLLFSSTRSYTWGALHCSRYMGRSVCENTYDSLRRAETFKPVGPNVLGEEQCTPVLERIYDALNSTSDNVASLTIQFRMSQF